MATMPRASDPAGVSRLWEHAQRTLAANRPLGGG